MDKLKIEILKALDEEEGVTLLELKSKLKGIRYSEKELKSNLKKLEEQNLIEERHFNDRVDYSLEHKGYKLLHSKF